MPNWMHYEGECHGPDHCPICRLDAEKKAEKAAKKKPTPKPATKVDTELVKMWKLLAIARGGLVAARQALLDTVDAEEAASTAISEITKALRATACKAPEGV